MPSTSAPVNAEPERATFDYLFAIPDHVAERSPVASSLQGVESSFALIAAGRYDAATAPQRFPFLENYRTGSHLKYLYMLIDWCAAGGTELILLDVPVTADLEARYPAAFAEYRGRLTELERDRGVTVLRPTRAAAGLTDAEFGDVIHLNRAGAARLSAVRSRCAR